MFLLMYHHLFGMKGFQITIDLYYGPLVAIVLGFVNEVFQEIHRFMNDVKMDNMLYRVVRNGKLLQIKNKSIKVGDIIKLNKGDRIPADIMLLHTDDSNHICYVQTDQIDGEIDWKIKEPLQYTQKLIDAGIEHINSEQWEVVVEAPNMDLKSFQANLYSLNNNYHEPVKFTHFLMTNTKVVSGNIYGLVVYVGKESKLQLNKVKKTYLKTQIDIEINNIVKLLLATYIGVIALFALISHLRFKANFMHVFLDACLIFNNFISFSIVIVSQLMGYVHVSKMKRYGENKLARANSFLKTEELGRIQIILSDKTGTMTKNQMVFKNFVTPYQRYSADTETVDIKNKLKAVLAKQAAGVQPTDEEEQFKECIMAFILCNNIVSCTAENNEPSIQASNPDEVACLAFCESLGFKINLTNHKIIEVEDIYKNKEVYEILHVFPFSSERRRTDLIIQNQKTQEIKLYLKGADEVVSTRVKCDESAFIKEKARESASQGLRALSFCYKSLSTEEYTNFTKKLLKINKKFYKREILSEHAIYELEKDSIALCVTGTEDILQDNVHKTLDILRNANINLWMITGDKIETAKCISLSSGLKPSWTEFMTIATSDYDTIQDSLRSYDSHLHFLVVSGDAYNVIENHKELKEVFYSKAVKARDICFCRFLPTQKALLAANLTQRLNKVVAAIGDGANDVNMLETASVGIGINGLDGSQAALASDYAITQFSDLVFLLIFSGQSNYFRTATILRLIKIAKLTTAFIVLYFSMELHMVFYRCLNSFFMCFMYDYYIIPIFCAFLFYDEDLPINQTEHFARLYRENQNGNILKPSKLVLMLFISILQAFIIVTLILCFTYLNLGVVTNTLIIASWTLYSLSFITKFNKITRRCYLMFGVGLVQMAATHYFVTKRTNPMLFHPHIVLKGISVGLCAFLPVHIVQLSIKYIYPDKRLNLLKLCWKREKNRQQTENLDIIDL